MALGAGVVVVLAVAILVHPQPALLQQGSSAPAVALRDASGTLHRVVGKGMARPALIEFLSAGCSTCRASAQQLCDAAGDGGVVVAAVDAGNDTAQTVSSFAQRYLAPPCSVPLLLDPGLSVSRAYQVGVVPTLYVVDNHGNIAYAGYGAAGITQAVQALRRLSGD
ncbi:MAG TPA: TlpA disulfide reductase family protein [Dehalococcoidia bacterium]|nr:TlpA disulfide reductase family protein [Dehalococcoidia bacterium]